MKILAAAAIPLAFISTVAVIPDLPSTYYHSPSVVDWQVNMVTPSAQTAFELGVSPSSVTARNCLVMAPVIPVPCGTNRTGQ